MNELELMRERFRYDPETGAIYLLATGQRVGSKFKRGYIYVNFKRRQLLAHRLAWLLMTGEWPKHFLDHINRDKTDNRWANLREASSVENAQNMGRKACNRSGYIGVYFKQSTQKFCAQIRSGGKRVWLGAYATPHEAGAAYMAAKARLHKFAA
jgi:hypothetical protein